MWPRRYLPWVALPNVLSGRFVVPEILQDDATPANLAQALANQLRDKVVRARQARAFDGLYAQLRQGAARRAAEAVMPLLAARGRAAPQPALAAAGGSRA